MELAQVINVIRRAGTLGMILITNDFYTEISGMFSEFEEWGKCFTSDERDHILICNVDSDVGSETSSNVGSETSSPSYASTYAPSYSPCGNFDLCRMYCPSGDGTCTADSCTTIGYEWEGGYANCSGYYKLLSDMYLEFEEWGKCFRAGGDDVLYTCNIDNEISSNVDSETSSNVDSETSSSSEADTGMIIGIVVSAVVLITIILCWVLYKRSLKTLIV